MRFGRERVGDVPVLGALEIEILRRLWAAAEALDARTVRDRLQGRSCSLSTVQSTLERLCRKRLIEREKLGRCYFYRSAVSREQLITRLLGDLADRLAGGDLEPFVSGFLDFVGESDPELFAQIEADARRGRQRQ